MKITLKPIHIVFIIIAAVIATLAIQFISFTAQKYISYCIEKSIDYYPAFLNIFAVFISSLISAIIALIVVHIQINAEREKNKEELQRKTVLSLKMIFQELEYNQNILKKVTLAGIDSSDVHKMLQQLSDRYWLELMTSLELQDEPLLPDLTSVYFKLTLIRNSPEGSVNDDTLSQTKTSIDKLSKKINIYLQSKGA